VVEAFAFARVFLAGAALADEARDDCLVGAIARVILSQSNMCMTLLQVRGKERREKKKWKERGGWLAARRLPQIKTKRLSIEGEMCTGGRTRYGVELGMAGSVRGPVTQGFGGESLVISGCRRGWSSIQKSCSIGRLHQGAVGCMTFDERRLGRWAMTRPRSSGRRIHVMPLLRVDSII
jgi:hypothetical protein